MAELILGPMLRHVTETTATIWLETDGRCTIEILGRVTPTFCVAGHHYALVIIDDLEPGSTYEYDVHVDGRVCWPGADSTMPASRIRTTGGPGPVRIVFGSCRTAAPHEPPWTLQLALDSRGRGVDAVWAKSLQMLHQPEDEWPDLAVFLGDQIYADDSSPRARERIAEKRAALKHPPESRLPAELVDGFEEYTWLYHESWAADAERWFFSNVPSVMIFDDHEMIDDWNISDAWVTDIRGEDWWQDHVVGGLMTYWLYQHLGNLAPETIRSEAILDALLAVDDGEQRLRQWALQSEEFTPVAGGYRFNYLRDIGRVRLVMIDARNGRVLEPNRRQIVDDGEWDWIVESCNADVDHLLIGTSLPVFVPGALHDFQVWNEAVCDGAWRRPAARFGEWLRVKADMEDWPAFARSFDAFVDLLEQVGGSSNAHAPATISVLSGDIHFSYAAEIRYPPASEMSSRVHQLVNSPIRNELTPAERTAMKAGMTRFARGLGRVLRRSVRRRASRVSWRVDRGPIFANCLGELTFVGREARLTVNQARPLDDSGQPVFEPVIEVDLREGSAAVREPAAGAG